MPAPDRILQLSEEFATQIASTDNLIGALVYELYLLTEGEIRIVECK